jgi:uncharacterized CHY-type Zn-finger protein
MVAQAALNCSAASSLLISSIADLMPSTIPEVRGLNLDPQTRCLHYHSPLDIIAIKMKCCATYYACKDCHDALADHSIEPWPLSEWETPAILCGSCRAELTISNYLNSNSCCPYCQAAFNPRCRNHYHFYFVVSPHWPHRGA